MSPQVRALFLQRRRRAVERALRSARPVDDRAADIAMELLEDISGPVPYVNRAHAAQALTRVLQDASPQTVPSLALAICERFAGDRRSAMGRVYDRLMELAMSIRRDPSPPTRHLATSQSMEAMAA